MRRLISVLPSRLRAGGSCMHPISSQVRSLIIPSAAAGPAISTTASGRTTLHPTSAAVNAPAPDMTQRWNSGSTDKGDELYQQAMDATAKSQELQKEKEKTQNERMFEAWQSSQESSASTKVQGVKVVQTLAKATRSPNMDDQIEACNQLATRCLKEAALQHQHPMALVQLANRTLQDLKHDDSMSRDDKRAAIDEAMDMFQKAGDRGNRVGYYNLGQLLWTGYPAFETDDPMEAVDEAVEKDFKASQLLPPDVHRAMEIFTHAIDLGDVDAMYLVGVHRMATGGSDGVFAGYKLVQKAADLGHGGAKYYLALLHLNGEEKLALPPCTPQQFMQRLDDAVAAGDLDATFTRAHSYYHGTEGYEQDEQKALLDFLKAADAGHADSAVSAGAVLFHGVDGVIEPDMEKAFQLYQQAGELGSKEGWQNVVECYRSGQGVPQSESTAQYIEETMLRS